VGSKSAVGLGRVEGECTLERAGEGGVLSRGCKVDGEQGWGGLLGRRERLFFGGGFGGSEGR